MKTQIPMASGTPYPDMPLFGSVTAKTVKTSMKVRTSSTPNAWTVVMLFAGAVTPKEPIDSCGVRPYITAAPQIAEDIRNMNCMIKKEFKTRWNYE